MALVLRHRCQGTWVTLSPNRHCWDSDAALGSGSSWPEPGPTPPVFTWGFYVVATFGCRVAEGATECGKEEGAAGTGLVAACRVRALLLLSQPRRLKGK